MKRYIIFHLNVFQKQMLSIFLIVFIIGCSVSWLNFIYYFLSDTPNYYGGIYQLRTAVPWILIFLVFALMCLIFLICILTNKYSGPVTRILKELDEIEEGKRIKLLQARAGDTMFNKFIERMNRILKSKVK